MSHTPDLPAEMRAVVLSEYRAGIDDAIAGLEVVPRPVPSPGRGEVLVRMEAAPVNPSDLLFLQGLYGVRKKLPTVPGWEGAGTVVASGGGLFARSMIGKRVACGGQSDDDGTWAGYYLVKANQCIPLHRPIDFEQGATSVINPLTALGMLDRIRKGGHPAAVQNAAVSQVGLMMARLCRRAGIPLIHVVRRQEQAEILKGMGESHVLDSSVAGFEDALRDAVRRLGVTIAFDAVAGEMTGTLVDVLPKRSTVVVYGALSLEKCGGVDPIQLIFSDKRVEGFYLGDWLIRKSLPARFRTVRKGQALVADGTLRTHVARRIRLDDLREGLTDYVRKLSEGKAIILLR
jgi:NADPH:quinone reductase-like Zn-dependent oxidoreductase